MFFLFAVHILSVGHYCLVPQGNYLLKCSENAEKIIYNQSTKFIFEPDGDKLTIELSVCGQSYPTITGQNWTGLKVDIISNSIGQKFGFNQSLVCSSISFTQIHLMWNEMYTLTTSNLSLFGTYVGSPGADFFIKDYGTVYISGNPVSILPLLRNETEIGYNLAIESSILSVDITEKGFNFRILYYNFTNEITYLSLTLITTERSIDIHYNYNDSRKLANYPTFKAVNYCEVSFDNWTAQPVDVEKIVFSGENFTIIEEKYDIPNVTIDGGTVKKAQKGRYCIYNDFETTKDCPDNFILMKYTKEKVFDKEFSSRDGKVYVYLTNTSLDYHPYFTPTAFRDHVMISGINDSIQYIELNSSQNFFKFISLHSICMIPSEYNKIAYLYLDSDSSIYPTGMLTTMRLNSHLSNLLMHGNTEVITDNISIIIDTEMISLTMDEKALIIETKSANLTIKTGVSKLSINKEQCFMLYSNNPSVIPLNAIFITVNATMIIDESCYDYQISSPKELLITGLDDSYLTIRARNSSLPKFFQNLNSSHVIEELIPITPTPSIPSTKSQRKNSIVKVLISPYFYASVSSLVLVIIIVVIVIWWKKKNSILAPTDQGITVISLLDVDPC